MVGQQHDRPPAGLSRKVLVRIDLKRRQEIRIAARERIVEQAERFLQIENSLDSAIDVRLLDQPSLQRLRQSSSIGITHEIDIDARLESGGCRFGHVAHGTVRQQFGDRVVVADHDAVEAPLIADQIVQYGLVRRHRNAGEIVKARHERNGARIHRGLERWHVDFEKSAFGNVDGVIVASGLRCAITGEVLGGCRHVVGLADIITLNPAHLGDRVTGGHPRILARPFGNASPSRIARYVDHRRIVEVDTVGGGF